MIAKLSQCSKFTTVNSVDEFFRLAAKSSCYLNRRDFSKILETIYRIRCCSGLVAVSDGAIGVPAFEVKSFLSGHKITSMPFNYYPPLVGFNSQTDAMDYLIDNAKTCGPKCYVEYKTFETLPESYVRQHSLKRVDFSVVSNLALCQSMSAQRLLYKKQHRTNVNAALKNNYGLIIEPVKSIADLAEWYNILVKRYRDKHRMITQPFELYRRIFQLQDLSTLLVAKRENAIVGGIFILRDSDHWEYSWGATAAAFDKIPITTVLIDTAISMAISQNASSFGFGSSSVNDKPLRFFKERWGCKDSMLSSYYWNHTPNPVDLNDSYKTARFFYSCLPVSLLRHVPRYVVPHLV